MESFYERKDKRKRKRQIQIYDHFKLEIMKNLAQIKYLNWIGDYREDNKKIENWNALWKGQEIGFGGSYNFEGLITAVWNELFENYWEQQYKWYQLSKSKFICQGEYLWIQKMRLQCIQFYQNSSGGGEYDNYGKKKGQWIDLQYNYGSYNFIINTIINVKLLKLVNIKMNKKKYLNDEFEQIAGGYNDQNGLKLDNWIELHDNFWNLCPIIQEGQHNQGVKRGQWNIIDIKNRQIVLNNILSIFSGGRLYNEDGKKIGDWHELFNNYWRECSVLNKGQYQKGIKQGKWECNFRRKKLNKTQVKLDATII